MKKFFHTVLTLFLLLIIFLLLFVGYISLRYMNWEKEFEKGKDGNKEFFLFSGATTFSR